jgi:predicted Zn-dependent protease
MMCCGTLGPPRPPPGGIAQGPWYTDPVQQSTATGGAQPSFQSRRRTGIELAALLALLVALFFAARGCAGCVAEGVAERLPPSVDAKLGELGAEQFRARYRLAGKEPTEAERARVERIFAELRGALTKEEAERVAGARVTVVVDEQVNAFALPGGEVFVLTGLLERVGDDDALVRGVLAHELGHAVERHGVRGIARGAAMGMVLMLVIGQMDDLMGQILAGASQLDGLRYSRSMESEADAFGVDLLRRAGHDPDGLARFLESLETVPVPELLSTHPDSKERAEQIRTRMR